jgi:hypothetical protein
MLSILTSTDMVEGGARTKLTLTDGEPPVRSVSRERAPAHS